MRPRQVEVQTSRKQKIFRWMSGSKVRRVGLGRSCTCALSVARVAIFG